MVKTNTCIIVTFLFLACASIYAEDHSKLQQEIITTIQQRHDAYMRGDRTAYSKFVDPDSLFVEPGNEYSGTKQISGIHPTVGYKSFLGMPENLTIKQHGNIVIATYHEINRDQFGEQPFTSAMRVVDTYERKGNTWVLVLHVQINDPTPRKPAHVNAATLSSYAGQYELTPGFTETISVEGDHLRDISIGDEEASQLLPMNESEFFIPNDEDDGVITFVKNNSGAVTQYVYRAHGQELIARKVK